MLVNRANDQEFKATGYSGIERSLFVAVGAKRPSKAIPSLIGECSHPANPFLLFF